MQSWVFLHLDELRSIYGATEGGTRPDGVRTAPGTVVRAIADGAAAKSREDVVVAPMPRRDRRAGGGRR
ncbi:MAG: hypothetical protein AAF726_20015 [Planctomycetota bacterium]